MDIYDFFEACKQEGLTGEEAMREYQRGFSERSEDLTEMLEERQSYYTYQEDLINRRRMEM